MPPVTTYTMDRGKLPIVPFSNFSLFKGLAEIEKEKADESFLMTAGIRPHPSRLGKTRQRIGAEGRGNATSAASRPLASSTLPMRGTLLRASNVYTIFAAEDKPRTKRQNRPAEMAAACQRRQDSRCSSGPGRSGRGRTSPPDAHNRGRRPDLPDRLPMPFASPGRDRSRTHPLVHEIADRLYPRPARQSSTKQTPSQILHPVAIAETARQQKDDGLLGEIFTGTWAAPGTTSSGRPVSVTMASVERII